ncbi:MAG: sulfatase-like hydrolase/transferase [Hydrotalea sp.]|nr:sulfatase-like hydrolase/transferase [Hydrotalea sp.]
MKKTRGRRKFYFRHKNIWARAYQLISQSLPYLFIIALLEFFFDPAVIGFGVTLILGFWLARDMINHQWRAKQWPGLWRGLGGIVGRGAWGRALLIGGWALIVFLFFYHHADIYNGGWKDSIRSRFNAASIFFNLKADGYFFFIAACLLSFNSIKKKKYLLPIVLLPLSFFTLLTYQSISDYLRNTGDESILEIQHFDLKEAWALINSLMSSIGFACNIVTLAVALLGVVLMLVVKHYVEEVYPAHKKYFAIFYYFLIALMILLPIHRLYARSIKSFINHRHFLKEVGVQYVNLLPPLSMTRQGLQMVVYVGESTSAMHWSLYGYYRETTPRLDKLAASGKLLVFNNVFATFSHTTPSLLNVFSFRPTDQNIFTPIDAQSRIPLIEVLINSGIKNYYISTQPDGMAWASFSVTIFRNMETHFNTTKDNIFLLPWLSKLSKKFANNNNTLVWLHSYAGHTPYLQSLPINFIAPIDASLSDRPLTDVIKNDGKASLIKTIDAYDSAMNYIDNNINAAIKQIANNPHPVVFIYFSDHGESPDYNLGHDSSRFRHDMLRVPFIIYFNDAARQTYPALFARYQNLAARSQQTISLLNQLPYTIVDIFGGDIRRYAKMIVVKPAMGGKGDVIEPVLIRNTGNGLTYINLNSTRLANAPNGAIDSPDATSKIYLENFYGKKTCYKVEDVRSAVVGAFVASCLIVDSNTAGNQKLFATIKNIAKKRESSVVIAK